MKLFKSKLICLISVSFLASCASTSKQDNQLNLNSYLESTKKISSNQEEIPTVSDSKSGSDKFKQLQAFSHKSDIKRNELEAANEFSSNDYLQVSADQLSIKDYIHYIFGDVLAVNYIIDNNVTEDSQTISLNVQDKISKRKLFLLSEELLTERGYRVSFRDSIFYVNKVENGSSGGEVAYGYGNKVEDVPNTSLDIIQLIPFEYGFQSNLSLVLQSLANVTATTDNVKNAFRVRGKRREIIKAIDFINLMDQPGFKNRHIGIYKTTFSSVAKLKDSLSDLLHQEGISVSSDNKNDQAISFVNLDTVGKLIIFANNQALLNRAQFWLAELDVPASGNELQYFIYNPSFSRASDLGESLSALVGRGGGSGVSGKTTLENENQQANSQSAGASAVSSDDLKLVVDPRSNTLVFHTTGERYSQLLPIIKRLDTMPKQVMLEVMIAEVRLEDVFKQGVEFALTNRGANRVGGFNLSSGAGGLNYLLSGTQGSIELSLLQTNQNVNVLSKPSIVVRDGVSANINVGDDVPTVGEIVTDPVNGSKTSIVYRKTGVELKVTPTINAQGIVIMEIDQKISNQAVGDASVEGSPSFFERSIQTEVVAESGQMVVLGGLISENRTTNDRTTPFFSSIPILGNLFSGTDNNTGKTELVVFVTPKIIESSNQWQEIKTKLFNEFSNLKR